jgi:hypothetical protein
LELESGVGMPVARRRCRPVIFEVLSATDDLVHLVAEDDFDRGIAAGDGWYLAVSGERIIAHAITADSERRCPACRAALRRAVSASRRALGAIRLDGRHRRQRRPKPLITFFVGLLTSDPTHRTGRQSISAEVRTEPDGDAPPPLGVRRDERLERQPVGRHAAHGTWRQSSAA